MKSTSLQIAFVLFALVFQQTSFAQARTVFIDDFKDGDGAANTLEYWYAYTDKNDKGASTIGNAKNKDGYVVVMKDGANWVAKIQNYVLNKGGNPNDPYVALGLEAKNNGRTYDLSKCANGFSYRYKGSAHNFRTEQSTVNDYAFHQKQLAASVAWANATVPFSQLKQPNWGAPKAFNAKNIKAFSWEAKGNVSAKSGSLAISDFKCLGDMPLPAKANAKAAEKAAAADAAAAKAAEKAAAQAAAEAEAAARAAEEAAAQAAAEAEAAAAAQAAQFKVKPKIKE